MPPVVYDCDDRVAGLSEGRERRLLKMAKLGGFNCKPFYAQYCLLSREGLTGWALGQAYILPLGEERLRDLA
jgi:hypothetical protein